MSMMALCINPVSTRRYFYRNLNVTNKQTIQSINYKTNINLYKRYIYKYEIEIFTRLCNQPKTIKK